MTLVEILYITLNISIILTLIIYIYLYLDNRRRMKRIEEKCKILIDFKKDLEEMLKCEKL